jgi:hypothetical protein
MAYPKKYYLYEEGDSAAERTSPKCDFKRVQGQLPLEMAQTTFHPQEI